MSDTTPAAKTRRRRARANATNRPATATSTTTATTTTTITAVAGAGNAAVSARAPATTTGGAASSSVDALAASLAAALPTSRTGAEWAEHRFWSTQPVPRPDEHIAEPGPVEPDRRPEDIRQTPYELLDDYQWVDIDAADARQLDDLYTLLNENYVEDNDSMFRFDYSRDFLQW